MTKCLWLTLADPDPADNGQFLYSSGLIQGVASLGAALDVVGLRRPGSVHVDGQREGPITWHLAEHRPRSNWVGLVSALPNIASRTKTASMHDMVDALCARADWDLIVFDSITTGWALAAAERQRGAARRPKIVHISHNHEESVALKLAADETRSSLRKGVRQLDAVKAARLERNLIRRSDLVTSNTPEDRARVLALAPDKTVLFLPPGYNGPRVVARAITAEVPRRAVVVGSFDWITKRQSLEAFLDVADRAFADAGIELDIVGRAEAEFLNQMRQRFPHTRFTGRVEDVVPYMAAARVALVPDIMGGFKLKGLDYVFNRLPVIGIDGAVPGMPLKAGESILLCQDHRAIVDTVLGAIDDFDRLNDLQNRAYAACDVRFDWRDICRELLDAVAALDEEDTPMGATPQSWSMRSSISSNTAAARSFGRNMKL